jgi:6-phosphogluconolactonase
MAILQHLIYASGYATAAQPGIHAFHFDGPSGELLPRWSFAGIANPSFILSHPNGRWLYAVSETSQAQDGVSGGVWALALADQERAPEKLNQRMSGGDWPCHLALDASGRWLLVSNYGSGNLSVFPILEDGKLGEMTDLIQHHGSGPNAERQEGPHVHSAIFSPDNRFVFVADLGIDQIVSYTLDTTTGKLHQYGETHTAPGSGPRHMTFHPNGQHFYVASELANTVTMYDYHAENGTLSEQQTLSTLPPDAPENTVADIHFSPDGRLLYVSNRGHDSIATYTVAESGQLELLSIKPCGGRGPRNFAVSPEGAYLLVANQQSNRLVVLECVAGEPVNVAAPLARAVGSLQVEISGASCVQFVPRI